MHSTLISYLPGGPGEHVTPFDWQMCGLNSDSSLLTLRVELTKLTWRLFLLRLILGG